MSEVSDRIPQKKGNEMTTWNKWDYLCTSCDGHVEMTIKSNGKPHSEVCPKCQFDMTLMSVVDATIPDNKKEGGI